ncbi:thymidine phosphorylase family protein [Sphingomonas sp. ID1715]|uniref:thymidine phosphorylase family protein n=1 Tax=Sphingomonas sp. ID1715 TaxID=1656898 RepID=UPI0014881387|nr:thymidine phosphorylase family protein [Sphingomonas sp. ID1715]NNM77771.1 thymidine phosphorylase family protein [Sphingomonas sp. ID1715]
MSATALGRVANDRRLKARRLGIESQHEALVLMHRDCPVCRSEGFSARSRVELRAGDRSALATLYQVTSDIVAPNEAGLSEAAWRSLGISEGAMIAVHHPQPLSSLGAVRSKLYGHCLSLDQLRTIIGDVVEERYSDVELATFISAFAAQPFSVHEATALTRAMLEAGEQLAWPSQLVLDKHCVGGLPANRTTPIVVAIVAAAGLMIPKTSSRAITSPAGTADTMETMAPVELDLGAMRSVVEREGGCLVWGGSVRLSPADDIIIRVERAIDVDAEAQLIASVLSKKLAAGSTHVLLDLPFGPTAKVRSLQEGTRLSSNLSAVAREFGLIVKPILTDGSQPVGNGIGPSLEGRDVLAVLRNEVWAPQDLRSRAVTLAGALLEMGGAASIGGGEERASALLADGRALAKFMAICTAQGGFREPQTAGYTQVVHASHDGEVRNLDNRLMAKVAKLAGAPQAKAAGLDLHVKLGQRVVRDQPLFTIHGETEGEIAYARTFADASSDMLSVARL